MAKHRIVGWKENYCPVNEHKTENEIPHFYWVACTCGWLVTGWNEAVCFGKAGIHLKANAKDGTNMSSEVYGGQDPIALGWGAHTPKMIVDRAVLNCHEVAVRVSCDASVDGGSWNIRCDVGDFAMDHGFSFSAHAPTYERALDLARRLAMRACELSTAHGNVMRRYTELQEELRAWEKR